eukprot:gene13160-13290_t
MFYLQLAATVVNPAQLHQQLQSQAAWYQGPQYMNPAALHAKILERSGRGSLEVAALTHLVRTAGSSRDAQLALSALSAVRAVAVSLGRMEPWPDHFTKAFVKWKTLLVALKHWGDSLAVDELEQIAFVMRDAGLKPDQRMAYVVIRACVNSGQYQRAHEVLRWFKAEGVMQYKPALETLLQKAAAGAAAEATGQCPFSPRVLGQYFASRGSKNSIKPGPAQYWVPPALSKPSTLDAAGYTALIDAIKQACDVGKLSPPTLCRLGFHSVQIAGAVGRGYGANGGFHAFEAEYDYPGNAGLGDDIAYLLKLRADSFPGITFADLFTLVGSLGPELAGGPPIAWYPGRLDTTGPGPIDPPLSAALPDGMLNAAGVQQSFEQFLGLTIREQVIFLGGGHSFGGADVDATGWNGTFTGGDGWPKPSNKYFVDLMNNDDWVVVVNPSSGKPQYVHAADGGRAPTGDTIFRLPADYALKEADVYRKWSLLYAADLKAFERDFQRTYQRAMQVGAGHAYKLMPHVFAWRGVAGSFEGFGTEIQPLDDDEAA